jgi:hypothetical protein
VSQTPPRDENDDRPARRDGAKDGGAARSSAPRSGAPRSGASHDGRPAGGKSAGTGRPAGGRERTSSGPAGAKGRDGRPARAGEQRLWTRDGKSARNDARASIPESRPDPDPFGTKSVRTRHDDPPIPDKITAKDLDRLARNELKTLAPENQEIVARHLAMVARLIDDDPQLAHQHAISAARRAGRIGIVRETLAITAYATGDYALALRELRTYRRISGRDDQLPMMVDSERGLGRPDRALELGRSVPRASLPVPVQVELAIAMSGARLDLGDAAAALRELEIPQLDPSTAFSYSPGLFDAYATVLEELGRQAEADEWFRRADIATAALGSDDDEIIEVIEEELAQHPDEDER